MARRMREAGPDPNPDRDRLVDVVDRLLSGLLEFKSPSQVLAEVHDLEAWVDDQRRTMGRPLN
jgi:hypothetical protein